MASRKPGPRATSADPVSRYAKAVVSGKKIAGPHVRAACQRHLNDLATGHQRGLVFDKQAAQRAIGYYRDVLRLNGGEFEGMPFELLDWQQFIIGSVFGWKGADGYRRFRVVYVETAKGSGKSPLAAGVGMIGLTADGESRAEVYAAATKKDQAMVLYRDAVAMYQQSPELRRRLKPSGVGENVWNLAYAEKGSFFRPISADDGQSGPRPHVALIDEIHEHRNNTVVEMMRAGTKSRRQALIFMITNSGASKTSACWNYHDYAAKVSAGTLVDDAFFGYVCALDEGDDPFNDEKCWPKVNPSLQGAKLPGLKYLREQVTEARGMPSKEALVRRLNFCQWTDATNPWISADVWLGAAREYDWRDFRGRRAWAGLDLSSTTDLTGLVLYVEPVGEGEPWRMVPFAWLPEEGLQRKEELDRVPYLAWRTAGYLETTPGRAISKLTVIKRLAELSSFFDLQLVGYDRWRIEDLKALATDNAIDLPEMQPFGQGYKDMSPAIETFETALLNGTVVHPGNPVFTWCAANAVITSDDAENRKLSKEKATGRIDLMVAAVMAVGCGAIRAEEPPTPGIYIL
ncbi:terminase large subunit [Polaromonas jejuensis]|uniref:Terminase large subunit n=1 Tax=Polaromonas jejuensis TaxID=457502 RepID=A0ABW0QGI7_9BURK|nr:terminase TerL endonuclease subunit [Polaromonas jejuensis]